MTTAPSAPPTTGVSSGLVLPGPSPHDFEPATAGGRSALVVAAHPGDVLLGFAVGVHLLQQAGWEVRIVTVFDDPTAGRSIWAAVRVAQELADRGRLVVAHQRATGAEAAAEVLAAVMAERADHDLVVTPAAQGRGGDHALVAGLLATASPVPVMGYVLPGSRLGDAARQRLRRLTAVREDVRGLVEHRAGVRLPCVEGRVWGDDPALATATDLVLI
jgi:hypothetical protein